MVKQLSMSKVSVQLGSQHSSYQVLLAMNTCRRLLSMCCVQTVGQAGSLLAHSPTIGLFEGLSYFELDFWPTDKKGKVY